MRLALPALAAVLAACGPPTTTRPDAGPDTSCGLDCAAQNRFGLVVNRCFEYSSDPLNKQPLPAMGAWVKPVFTLEGGVKVLPVEYRVTGQINMIDNFAFRDGELYLMRREFSRTGQSVTYKDSANAIVGVKWLSQGTGAGETLTTAATGFLVNQSGNGTNDATTYKVTTFAGTTSELRTPLETYPSGLKLIYSETPNHGSDTRRVWVPDVGFVLLASDFSLTPGSPTPLVVQRIRDIGTPDAGTEDCSLGAP